MTKNNSKAQKLYLFELSTTSVPMADGKTLEMVSGCYLVETNDGHHILIDSGFPSDRSMPGVPPAENRKNVLQHLNQLGLSAGNIDMVIATHFDVDHVGYHDSFQKAEFVVQRQHYEIARTGHPRFAAARPHWDHPALRYRLIDGDVELMDGVTLLETSGHVLGHQSVLLRLPRTGPVLLAIDAVMMERSFTMDRKAWPKDENEQQLLASTRKLLDVVDRDRVAVVVFGHDDLQWRKLKKAPEYYE
jgi:N-acyl homoserine lactone hydrolase